jgi:DNA-binding Lrp family transcriptional regulator
VDERDREILDALQAGMPVCAEPYARIALQLGATAEDVHARVQKMRREGVIRRFGAILDSRSLGMSTTLAAVDVAEADIESVAQRLDSYPEVTHSYLRLGHPNIWFTLVAASREVIDRRMAEISSIGGVRPAGEFPATKIFKIGVKVNASAAPEQS